MFSPAAHGNANANRRTAAQTAAARRWMFLHAARRRKPPQPAAECPRLTRAAAHGGGI